ncbi:MAG: 9-O-acetylesterase, partial [bacterium]
MHYGGLRRSDVGQRSDRRHRDHAAVSYDLIYSGPLYKSSRVEDNKIRITFDYTGTGLVARDGKALTHFSIAGEDKKFVEATAGITGNTVVVTSPDIARPVAVRFAWDQVAMPNLMNKEGLPAAPFRTDAW